MHLITAAPDVFPDRLSVDHTSNHASVGRGTVPQTALLRGRWALEGRGCRGLRDWVRCCVPCLISFTAGHARQGGAGGSGLTKDTRAPRSSSLRPRPAHTLAFLPPLSTHLPTHLCLTTATKCLLACLLACPSSQSTSAFHLLPQCLPKCKSNLPLPRSTPPSMTPCQHRLPRAR